MILVIDHPREEPARYADQYRLFRDDQVKEAEKWARSRGFGENSSPFTELVGSIVPESEGVVSFYRRGDVDIMVLRLSNP